MYHVYDMGGHADNDALYKKRFSLEEVMKMSNFCSVMALSTIPTLIVFICKRHKLNNLLDFAPVCTQIVADH